MVKAIFLFPFFWYVIAENKFLICSRSAEQNMLLISQVLENPSHSSNLVGNDQKMVDIARKWMFGVLNLISNNLKKG